MDNYCAISIMCKDENQYLKEWVDYHLLIGFDHIQIWDNESKVPIKDTVKEYIEKEVVSVKEIKTYGGNQVDSQRRSLKETLRDYIWVALIDTDEFIVLLDESTNVKDYLKKYEQYGAVGLNWLLFGSNGYKTTQKSQLESFTQPLLNHSANKLIKSIVSTKCYNGHHNMHFVDGPIGGTVNVKKQPINNIAFNDPPILDEVMRINHYFTRSKEDWELKRHRGEAGNISNPQEKYSKKLFDNHGGSQDKAIDPSQNNYDILNLIKKINDEKKSTSNNNI